MKKAQISKTHDVMMMVYMMMMICRVNVCLEDLDKPVQIPPSCVSCTPGDRNRGRISALT